MVATASPPSRFRRRMARLLLPVTILAIFLWVTGCVSTVTPPETPVSE